MHDEGLQWQLADLAGSHTWLDMIQTQMATFLIGRRAGAALSVRDNVRANPEAFAPPRGRGNAPGRSARRAAEGEPLRRGNHWRR